MFLVRAKHKTAFLPPFLQGEQNLKIKCKKCGKRFDIEMYSGLCPKCGTYNGVHMAETDISQYLGGSGEGEDAHQQLHNRYGDTGHAADAHRKLHDAYDNGYEAAHPADRHQSGTGRRERRFRLRLVLCLLILFIPAASTLIFTLWEGKMKRELLNGEIGHVELTNANSLLFADEAFAAPVEVTVLSAAYAELEELEKEDMQLIAVRARAFSEAYSFDARINNIALEYECDGAVSYQLALGRYDLEEYLPALGLTEEDILGSYSVGNGMSEEGYWFFCVPKDAQAFRLSVMACEGNGGRTVFLEGIIPLETVSGFLAGEREAEQ